MTSEYRYAYPHVNNPFRDIRPRHLYHLHFAFATPFCLTYYFHRPSINCHFDFLSDYRTTTSTELKIIRGRLAEEYVAAGFILQERQVGDFSNNDNTESLSVVVQGQDYPLYGEVSLQKDYMSFTIIVLRNVRPSTFKIRVYR